MSRREPSGRKGGGTHRCDAETGGAGTRDQAGPGRADAAQRHLPPSGVPWGGPGLRTALLSVLLLDGITGTSSPCAVSPSSHQAPGILGAKG